MINAPETAARNHATARLCRRTCAATLRRGGPGAAEFVGDPSPAQVVIISTDRHRATINGQTVVLGGRYGNATLVRISDEEIVLQRPEGTETIKLYSSVRRTKRWTSAQENFKMPGRREEGTHEAN